MKNFSVLRLSAISVALALCAGGAWAETTTVTGTNVTLLSGNGERNVSDAIADSTAVTSTGNVTATFSQFSSTTGVLTGATATLTVPASATSLSLSRSGSGTLTATGVGSVNTSWTLGGQTVSSVLINQNSAMGTSDSTWNNVVLTSSAGNLNNFVGAGNISGGGVTTVHSVNKAAGNGTVTSSVSQNLAAGRNIQYTYTKHGNASFESVADINSLAHDFGHVAGNTTANFGFNLYALNGGLGISGAQVVFQSGNNVFNITGTSGGIAAGSSASFNAQLLAQNPGVPTNYSGVYRIYYSDDTSTLGTFASNSVFSAANNNRHFVDVTLTAAVPEPGTYAMIIAGLSAIGFVIRRRRPRA